MNDLDFRWWTPAELELNQQLLIAHKISQSILRPGAVTREMVEDTLGITIDDKYLKF